jgi:hypothetical protein
MVLVRALLQLCQQWQECLSCRTRECYASNSGQQHVTPSFASVDVAVLYFVGLRIRLAGSSSLVVVFI